MSEKFVDEVVEEKRMSEGLMMVKLVKPARGHILDYCR